MPCWLCKAAILVLVILLIALLAQVAAVAAAVIEGIQVIVLALASIGLELSPLVVTGSLAGIAGFSLNELAEWLCCKAGVSACCES